MSAIQPLLISGPSGIGKTHLARYLSRNYSCARITPTTTRTPRSNELDGRDYHFLTEGGYLNRLEVGRMFMSNYFLNSYYGFERSEVDDLSNLGLTPTGEIYTPLITQFLQEYENSQALYLIPENQEMLNRRMIMRGDDQHQREYRLKEGEHELELYYAEFLKYYAASYLITEHNTLEVLKEVTSKFKLELHPNKERI